MLYIIWLASNIMFSVTIFKIKFFSMFSKENDTFGLKTAMRRGKEAITLNVYVKTCTVYRNTKI